MIFLITYDLNSDDKDYNILYDKIKSMGECFHPLESVWFLRSEQNANTIVDDLREAMNVGDHIFVVDITRQQRQGWLSKTAWNWLRENENTPSS